MSKKTRKADQDIAQKRYNESEAKRLTLQIINDQKKDKVNTMFDSNVPQPNTSNTTVLSQAPAIPWWRNWLIGLLIVLIIGCGGCMLLGLVGGGIALWPKDNNPVTAANPAIPSAPVVPLAAPAETLPYTWTASTCDQLSKEIGLKLSALKEGGFYACTYNGAMVPFNVPAGILADIDRGGIKVATGPVNTETNNITLRPWDGTLAEACAQVKNLSDYGQTQSPKFTASPMNFTCPK